MSYLGKMTHLDSRYASRHFWIWSSRALLFWNVSSKPTKIKYHINIYQYQKNFLLNMSIVNRTITIVIETAHSMVKHNVFTIAQLVKYMLESNLLTHEARITCNVAVRNWCWNVVRCDLLRAMFAELKNDFATLPAILRAMTHHVPAPSPKVSSERVSRSAQYIRYKKGNLKSFDVSSYSPGWVAARRAFGNL